MRSLPGCAILAPMGSDQLRANRLSAFYAQGGDCCYCGRPMWDGEPDTLPHFRREYGLTARQARQRRCTAEHLQALSDGGTSARPNIAAACAHCNKTRHATRPPKGPEEYREHVQKRIARSGWL